MRMLLFYILLVAFGCQQTTVNGQQTPFIESENLKNSESEKGCEQRAMSHEPFLESENLKTSESEKGCELRAMSHEQRFHNAQDSQHEAQSLKKTVDCCPLSVDYFESQIRLADSLYKNYLPQYNFEEVKAAVMFFDSLRLTADLLESENLKISETEKGCEPRAMSNEPFSETEKSVNISEICGNEKTNHKLVQKKSEKSCEPRAISNEPFLESENLKTSESEKRLKSQGRNAQSSQHEAQNLKKTVDCCPLTVDIEYQRARAHYYHAVGLTERDDIVGACEHYFIALEIMESETENLKTSKSEKRLKIKDKRLKVSVAEPVETPNDGVVPSTSSGTATPRTVDRCQLSVDNPEDYEKIRFLSLIYTRLGELFLSENYCDLAISKYRKALKYVLLLGENKAVANTYKCLGNSYHLYDMPDSALYYYNKSLETNSELPNRLDVEKCIAQILFDRGEKDSAYVMIKNNLGKIENQEIKESYMITLGNMYYEDNVYDSAIYYLEMCENSKIYYIRITSSIKLSAIYGSEQNYEKKAYHDNVISMLSVEKANKSVVDNNIHTIYNIYKEREVEREGKMERLHMRRSFSVVLIVILIMSLFTATFLHYIHTKRNGRLSKVIESKVIDINEKENVITLITNDIKSKEKTIEENRRIIHDKERRIAEMINELETKEQELSAKKNALEKLYNDIIRQKSEIESVNIELVRNKKEIDDMKQTLSAQEEIIRKQRCELHEIEKDRKTFDMEAYHNSEICRKILERKSTEYTLLKSEELVQLLDSANTNLGGLISNLNRDYPQLNKDELYCICLLLLNFNKTSLQYMLNRGRKTIWRRIDNICKVLEITTKNDMFMSLTKVLNEKYY